MRVLVTFDKLDKCKNMVFNTGFGKFFLMSVCVMY